ncbi:hypothetical protein A2U01_0084738, partial [Trifolium medium]|nr:hypothetical protein [Trifolium medium]
ATAFVVDAALPACWFGGYAERSSIQSKDDSLRLLSTDQFPSPHSKHCYSYCSIRSRQWRCQDPGLGGSNF